MITSLTLENFRSFKKKKFKFDKDFIVIYGDNAKGKSTLLEAIYLILNGESPWGASYENLLNNKDTKNSYYTIVIETSEKKTFSIYQDSGKRTYLIDKSRVSKKKFFEFQKANLFSPEQIELLMYIPQKRRDFLDYLISAIDIEYQANINTYKKVLKQRNAYLKKLSKIFFETGQFKTKDSQLQYWTNLLAELDSKIMVKRAEITDKLKTKAFVLEYRPSLTLNFFEDMLDESELKNMYLKQMERDTKKDIVTGFTNTGIHRDDWSIFSASQDLKRFGSRGEKRLAIARLILAKSKSS